jgi:hypothetical protein
MGGGRTRFRYDAVIMGVDESSIYGTTVATIDQILVTERDQMSFLDRQLIFQSTGLCEIEKI